MVSMRAQVDFTEGWGAYVMPHDGHPNARVDELVAKALLQCVQTLQSQ